MHPAVKAIERLAEVMRSCYCPRPQAELGGICARCKRPYITKRDTEAS